MGISHEGVRFRLEGPILDSRDTELVAENSGHSGVLCSDLLGRSGTVQLHVRCFANKIDTPDTVVLRLGEQA